MKAIILVYPLFAIFHSQTCVTGETKIKLQKVIDMNQVLRINASYFLFSLSTQLTLKTTKVIQMSIDFDPFLT